MRRFGHWTFRYAWDKAWAVLDEHRHPDRPWLTSEAVDQIEGWLQPTFRGIEWGAGRSTLWFARRVGALTSIEHDSSWLNRIEKRLHAEGLGNVALHLCGEETDEYVTMACRDAEGALDFALVDGRLRDRCAVRAASLVRAGGMVIVDDIERYLPSASRAPEAIGPQAAPASPLWERFAALVSAWEYRWTSNGIKDTALWLRPAP